MTQYLPPNLLALFAPRDPIPFLPPATKLPHEKKSAGYAGVGQFLQNFEDPKDTPPPTKIETREERLERKRREKAEQVAYKLEQDIALWDPHNNPSSTTNAFKSLFIARINYDTSESKLRREFEIYGPIKKIVMVHDVKSGKPRGYAFIEYEHERDMHSAYKHADGKKIDGRRVLVDVERSRTVKGWLPRRLGGGLGGTRRGGPEVNVKHSGREDSRIDERYMDREREREKERDRGGERDRDRERRRTSRERRRRSRSRSRDRERRERRKRSRERERDRDSGMDTTNDVGEDAEKRDYDNRRDKDDRREKDERRDKDDRREKDRERKRRRSRSRSRDRKRRDRDRDRGDRDRDRESRKEKNYDLDDRVAIKEEPIEIKEEPQSPGYSSANAMNYDTSVNYNYPTEMGAYGNGDDENGDDQNDYE